MGEGDRVEWLYRDYWRWRWKLGVVPGVWFGCFMSLLTIEKGGLSLGLLVGGLLGGTGVGGWMAWRIDRQWPQAGELTFAERWRVLRGLRSGTSPQEVHLARALLGQVGAADQSRQEDAFMASAARFDRTTFGAVVFPLVGIAGAAALAMVEFGNGYPIAGTTLTVLAVGIGVSVVSDLVRRLRGNGAETRRAAAVAAAQEVLAAEGTT